MLPHVDIQFSQASLARSFEDAALRVKVASFPPPPPPPPRSFGQSRRGRLLDLLCLNYHTEPLLNSRQAYLLVPPCVRSFEQHSVASARGRTLAGGTRGARELSA